MNTLKLTTSIVLNNSATDEEKIRSDNSARNSEANDQTAQVASSTQTKTDELSKIRIAPVSSLPADKQVFNSVRVPAPDQPAPKPPTARAMNPPFLPFRGVNNLPTGSSTSSELSALLPRLQVDSKGEASACVEVDKSPHDDANNQLLSPRKFDLGIDSGVANDGNICELNKERLRRQVEGFKNPYLHLHLSKKLDHFLLDLNNMPLLEIQTVCMKFLKNTNIPTEFAIDTPQGIWEQFINDKQLSFELRQQFASFIASFMQRALSDHSQQENLLLEMRNELTEFSEELKRKSVFLLEEIGDWKYLKDLLQLPSIMALNISDFIRLLEIIDLQNPYSIRDFIDTLDATKALDKTQLTQQLKELPDVQGFDLPTFLGELAQTKVVRSDGIITYWNRPSEFFVNKVLQVDDRSNPSHIRTIVQCEKSSQGDEIHFLLHDQSKLVLRMRGDLHATLTQMQHRQNFWSSVASRDFVNGDIVCIMQAQEANIGSCISFGMYKLAGLRNEKRHGKSTMEATLVDLETNRKRFLLVMHSETSRDSDSQTNLIRVARLDSAEQNSVGSVLTVNEFNQSFNVYKREELKLDKVNRENAERCIVIKSEPNQDLLRVRNFEKLDNALRSLRQEMMQEDCLPVFYRLLEDLVKKRLKSLDIKILDSYQPVLAKKVRALSRQYYDELRAERSPVAILKQVVLDANYALLVDKRRNVELARTMQLLSESFKHIEEMRDKDLVLFMGNTGAGKSTSISYLMGATLERFFNQVGETVLKVKKQEEAEDDNTTTSSRSTTSSSATTSSPIGQQNYPKIGQSIGTSETLYTQGFKIPSVTLPKKVDVKDFENLRLGDCPGFKDTRGEGHFLCTNLSIDCVVSVARNIRSIVVVVPANAFVMDRGNAIVNLVSTLNDKFPNILGGSTSDYSPRLFLLITKSNETKGEVYANLMNGTRFDRHVAELQEQLAALRQSGCDDDSLEYLHLKNRQNIWVALSNMLANGQIDPIDTSSGKRRSALLKKYAETNSPIDKSGYLSAMDRADIQKLFGDCIQMSTNTWSMHILDPYLRILPEKMAQADNTIQKELAEIDQYRLDEIRRKERIKAIMADQVAERQKIDKLETFLASKGVSKVDKESIRLALANDPEGEKVIRERKYVTTIQDRIIALRSTLEFHEGEMEKVGKRMVEVLEMKQANISKVERLKVGHYPDVLHEQSFEGVRTLTLGKNWKEGRWERAHRRGRVKESDLTGSANQIADAATWQGCHYNVAEIQRGYQLVPSVSNDPENQIKIISIKNKESLSFSSGDFEARIEGVRCTINLDCNPDKTKKRLCYAYTMDFKGDGILPKIKITHIIPNAIRNSATITDLEGEINEQEKELLELKLKAQGGENEVGIQKKIGQIKEEIAQLETEKAQKEQAIKRMEQNNKDLRTDQSSLNILRERVENLGTEINSLVAKGVHLNSKIESGLNRVRIEERKKRELSFRWRNLAIIIRKQWKSALQLRKFTDLIKRPDNNVTEGPVYETWNSWNKFITIFDQHQSTLLERIQQSHGF